MVVFGLMLFDYTIFMMHHRNIPCCVKFIVNYLLCRCAYYSTQVFLRSVFILCFIESMFSIILLIVLKENLVNWIDWKLISVADLIKSEMRFSSIPINKHCEKHHDIRKQLNGDKNTLAWLVWIEDRTIIFWTGKRSYRDITFLSLCCRQS